MLILRLVNHHISIKQHHFFKLQGVFVTCCIILSAKANSTILQIQFTNVIHAILFVALHTKVWPNSDQKATIQAITKPKPCSQLIQLIYSQRASNPWHFSTNLNRYYIVLQQSLVCFPLMQCYFLQNDTLDCYIYLKYYLMDKWKMSNDETN